MSFKSVYFLVFEKYCNDFSRVSTILPLEVGDLKYRPGHHIEQLF